MFLCKDGALQAEHVFIGSCKLDVKLINLAFVLGSGLFHLLGESTLFMREFIRKLLDLLLESLGVLRVRLVQTFYRFTVLLGLNCRSLLHGVELHQVVLGLLVQPVFESLDLLAKVCCLAFELSGMGINESLGLGKVFLTGLV